jgi:CheY-like chemotaxis protein
MNSKSTILVIEDDPDIQTLVRMVLSGEGYEVVEACNGHHALTILEQCRPDLIFLDMNMPVMNGWMFLMHYLDTAKDHPPIIATSAQILNPQNIPGINAFLPKPFDIGRLRGIIQQNLGKPAAV